MDRVSRREFLIAGAAAGGGLLLGWHVDARGATSSDFAPNAFIRIGTDGRVTMIMGQVEMGQGMYTAMPMLLAEELEVGLDQVRVEHAPPDDKLYGNPIFGFQATGGSTSVKGLYEPLRRSGGAVANVLLTAAAAGRNVAAGVGRAAIAGVGPRPKGQALADGALAD